MGKAVEEFQRLKKKTTLYCEACKEEVDSCVCKPYTKSDLEYATRNLLAAAKVKAREIIQIRIDLLAEELRRVQKLDRNKRDLAEKLRYTLGELETLKVDIGRIKYESISTELESEGK